MIIKMSATIVMKSRLIAKWSSLISEISVVIVMKSSPHNDHRSIPEIQQPFPKSHRQFPGDQCLFHALQ